MSNIPATTSNTGDLRSRVEDAINLIRPAIQQDGGDVELIDVTDDGIAKIRFHGACCGCPSANVTLYHGIRRVVVEKVPEIKQVIAIR